MGTTFEIEVWVPIEWLNELKYGYAPYWSGESFIVAIWKFIKAKREGHGCVTMHWRQA